MTMAEIEQIAGHVRLQPPDGYDFFGLQRRVDDTSPVSQAALAGKEPLYAAHLESDLYLYAYARQPGPPQSPVTGGTADARDDAALATSDPRPVIDNRALVVESAQPDGSVVVMVDEVRHRLPPGGFSSRLGDTRRVKAGDRVQRIWSPHQPDAQAAFDRVARGERPGPFRPGDEMRFYWNVAIADGADLTDALDAELSCRRIPFIAKRLVDRAHEGRRDSAVLYVSRRHAASLEPVIREVHGQRHSRLTASVPLFTFPLADGLGYSEDPASGTSFGQERARLVADMLHRVHEGIPLERAMAQSFAEAGLDVDHPHRNQLRFDRGHSPESWRW